MGVIRDLYAKNIEERSKPVKLSFGEIPMRVSGFAELSDWDKATAEERQRLIKNEKLELYAALVLKQWSAAPEIAASTPEEILSDIKETFTGDDVMAVIEWWVEISGVERASNFQKRR